MLQKCFQGAKIYYKLYLFYSLSFKSDKENFGGVWWNTTILGVILMIQCLFFPCDVFIWRGAAWSVHRKQEWSQNLCGWVIPHKIRMRTLWSKQSVFVLVFRMLGFIISGSIKPNVTHSKMCCANFKGHDS